MKAFIRDGEWDFTEKYVNYTDCNGKVFMKVVGLVMYLLTVGLQQMNMTFVLVSTREIYASEFVNLFKDMFSKKADIILGDIVEQFMVEDLLDVTSN